MQSEDVIGVGKFLTLNLRHYRYLYIILEISEISNTHNIFTYNSLLFSLFLIIYISLDDSELIHIHYISQGGPSPHILSFDILLIYLIIFCFHLCVIEIYF